MSKIASKFYNLKPKNIFAVTGTNGKTSVADLFYQILRLNNIPAASIGTLGIKYNNKIIKTKLTSPDTISIHKYLFFLKKKKIDNVIIEASSHGLKQQRLHHINFKAGVFTNFSQDHLDYHNNMRSYLNAKLILFKEILQKESKAISDKEIIPFKSLKKITKKRKIKLIEIKNKFNKIKDEFKYSESDFKIKNLAMAVEVVKMCGLKESLIYNSIKKLKDVSGRLELVRSFANNIKVFVDYAHTPDALLKTLSSLKNKYGDNISVVFGCGGDRDKNKRPFMAKIANENCKKVYITDDNPRNEDPKIIRKVLLKKIKKNKSFDIGDRALAIKKAIQNADPNEIILVAGKGHEDQQIYKKRINFISDKKIIKNLKIRKQLLNKKKQYYLQNKLILNKILGSAYMIDFNGISIDTRSIKKKNLFLALKGNNDGNKFISHAFTNGASVATSSINKKYKKTIKIKN